VTGDRRAPYRVAYVIGELGKGGAEYQLHELLAYLDRATFTPRVFVLAPGGWWADPIRRLGVDVVELPRRSSADPRRLARLRAALREWAPDVLHTILWSANCYGRLASAGLGIPVRIAAERNVIRRPSWEVAVERLLDRLTDCYLVNAEAVALTLADREGLPRRKVRVIPNGIDLGRLPPFTLDRRGARTAAGLDPDRRLVAQVGRLAPQKDHRTFLAAARTIAARLPDVDFLIVGEGAERAALEAEAVRLGLGARVRFTGERDDVPALLAGVDVLTLTSLYEGFPNVVVEAMATGAIAVATDVGGCRELVVDGETGRLVPPRAPDAVADAVVRVLDDPALARRLALAARRRVETELSVQAMADRTAAVYRALLQTGRVATARVAAA
jgi:glycosyltransferase involved in cell wall biosynthesis